MELLLLFLVSSLFLAIYLYATRNFKYWKKRGVPYEPPVPFLGNIPVTLFKKCLGTYMKWLYEKSTGPLYGFFILDKPILLIRDPEIIKQVLIKDFQYFYDRTMIMNKTDDPIGSQILFVLHNPEWRQVRQKMTVAFSSGKMRQMFPLMTEVGKDMIDYVEQFEGKPIEGKPLTLKFSTDVIASCAFGVKGLSFEKEDSQFHDAATKIFSFSGTRGIESTCYFIAPLLVRLFKMKFLHPHSTRFLKKVFWDVVDAKKVSKVKRFDLIDSLLEMRSTEKRQALLSDDDLTVAQAVQFIAAGYETSGSTAFFALYELAFHVDIQNRLRKEILDVCHKHAGLTYDAVKDMTYLDMVISETLRRYPILPFLDRRAQATYKIPGTDVTIEKGIAVFISLLGIHFDPQYYPDPTKFDPERFTPEKKAQMSKTMYMPFGEGPRNCIGARFGMMSAKLSVLFMVTHFEILKSDDMPSQIEFDSTGFLLHPLGNIHLRFKRIDCPTDIINCCRHAKQC